MADPVREAARAREVAAFEAWIRKQYDGEVTWERGDDFPSLAPLPQYSGHRDDDEVREDRDERSLWEEWSAWTARAALAALAATDGATGGANDAEGGIPGLDFHPPRDRTPSGYTRVEAYAGRGHLVVMGQPTDEDHSCDAMGCGSTGSHVVARIPLPPASAGEVETARVTFYEAARAYVEAKVEGTPHGCTYLDLKRAHDSLLAAERADRKGGDDDNVRRCEGCNGVAVTTDPDDVPLCRPCAVACCESAAKDRPDARKGAHR